MKAVITVTGKDSVGIIAKVLLMTRKCKHAILVLSKIGRSEKALF